MAPNLKNPEEEAGDAATSEGTPRHGPIEHESGERGCPKGTKTASKAKSCPKGNQKGEGETPAHVLEHLPSNPAPQL